MYKKPTDTGLLVHYQSHVDVRYKQSLLKAMLNCAGNCSTKNVDFSRRLSLDFITQSHFSTVRDFVTAKDSGDVS